MLIHLSQHLHPLNFITDQILSLDQGEKVVQNHELIIEEHSEDLIPHLPMWCLSCLDWS